MYKINLFLDDDSLRAGVEEVIQSLGLELARDGVPVHAQRMSSGAKGLKVFGNLKRYQIDYGRRCDFFRALALLSGACQKRSAVVCGEAEGVDFEGDALEIVEVPAFATLTHMVDCSRNAVLNVDSVKRLIRQLATLGFNGLMLYTEETYEVAGYPYFGYMRGRYTKEEIQECDAYGAQFGVELMPCVQTLAHLNAALKWSAFQEVKDIGDILLAGEEKTYDLIDAMMRSLAEMYTSRTINIGMDEAHMIGLGQYLDKHGYTNKFDIMMKHLSRVVEICKKYGFEPMMWSDMFFRIATGGEYYDDAAHFDEAIINNVPPEVSLIYWDYYSHDAKHYNRMMTSHENFKNPLVFAGGAWSWHGFAPNNNFSMIATQVALEQCKAHGIAHVIATTWGDNGNECSPFSVLPTLVVYAEACYANDTSKEHLARRCEMLTGVSLANFLLLDEINNLPELDSVEDPEKNYRDNTYNPSKYLLYNDILQGLMDKNVIAGKFKQSFANTAQMLGHATASAGEYAYLFETLACLADVLACKSEVGVALKAAYDARDLVQMKSILHHDLKPLVATLEVFYQAFKKQWYQDFKPFGFEVMDIRLGGLDRRVRTAITTVEAFLAGEITRIEELEVKRLLFYELRATEEPRANMVVTQYQMIASPNCI